MQVFSPDNLNYLRKRLETPENGEITIIGGSDLFHGAPLLSLKVASRIVDMVYFSSPEPAFCEIANNLKAQLSSFIWVPWDEIGAYIKKSDAVLIGPGMKRWHKEEENGKYNSGKIEVFDEAGTETKFVTEKLLREFPDKQWVIDGGSLQVINPRFIPAGAIITPNKREFEMIFNNKQQTTCNKVDRVSQMAKNYNCTIVLKGSVTYVCSPNGLVEVHGGNNGLTKGGVGDIVAGVTVGLAAKNDPLLSATSASWIVKRAGDNLYKKIGTVFNSDDLADEAAKVLGEYLK